MDRSKLSRLPDAALLQELKSLLEEDRHNTVRVLQHLAEVDRRKLYRPAGHPSLFSYCVHELHMSEAAAYRRICAVRIGRRFPAVFQALEQGRLHLDAVKLLRTHFDESNVHELIEAATHRTSKQVQVLIAERFPQPDMPTQIRRLPPPVLVTVNTLAAGSAAATQPSESTATGHSPVLTDSIQLVARPVEQDLSGDSSPLMSPLPPPPPRVTPIAPARFAVQVTVDQATHDLLQRARALLGFTGSSEGTADVLARALQELVERLEQRKFGDTSSPRQRRASGDSRYVSAEVRRRVVERDGRQCTFASASGARCPERTRLEFDHVTPVARGGRSTVENVRLRCRAHNQLAAEHFFGAGFMQERRERAGAPVAQLARSKCPTIEALRIAGSRPDAEPRNLL